MIQSSFWHYEIECIWKKKKRQGIRLRNMWHHNILLMPDCTAVGNEDTLRCVFCSHHPIYCAGPDTGCEGSEPERSTAGPYCIVWSLKLGCLILGALNSRSWERLCQQELKVGPLVIRRYAFVFGCFFRAPIILLGASHTFLPTLLFVSITSIHYGAPSTLL